MTRPSTTDSNLPSVVVVGGGLAGIAAALRLADRGYTVTLVETRKRLGGRATSFVDPATGALLDNCQHVLMGCCTNLIDLYRRLGVLDQIQWHRRLYFADSKGRVDELEADDLPAPLHMARSLMGFQTLTVLEKAAIVRGLWAMIRMGPAGRQRCHDMTFGQWLKQHHQPASAIKKFWSVIVVSALNEWPSRVDAAYAIQVFQEGFLCHDQAYVMGLSAAPLVRLYDAAQRVITQAGGRVWLSAGADRFEFDGQTVTGLRLADGRRLGGDAFISALPADRLSKLCNDAMQRADPRLQQLEQLTSSPIIGLHLWFDAPPDRPIMKLPHLILIDSPLQWLFNKGYDPQLKGQHLHGVISAAHDRVDQSAQQLIEMAVSETQRVLGANGVVRHAPLLHARVVKEKRATFSATPGIDRRRPRARGAIGNLYLAGDWCCSGWPATMEGATRSGYLAAAEVLQDQGQLGEPPLVPDLRPGPLYRVWG